MTNQPVVSEDFTHDTAIKLHDLMCHWNHTDDCGWFYETTWDGYTHARYLRMAKYVIENSRQPDYAIHNIVTVVLEARKMAN